MPLTKLCSKFIYNEARTLRYLQKSNITNLAVDQSSNKNNVVISCRRKEYNFYSGQNYDKFDQITLASKGWNHHKSKGDYFTIHPTADSSQDLSIPLTDTNIDKNLIQYLQTKNINKISEFQKQAISTIAQGNHAILAAETGCGKTLAYLLPIIQNIASKKNPSQQMNSPQALILTPNRELAYQIGSVAETLAESVGLTVKVIVGGRTKKLMLNPEFSDIDILIGTPGAIGKLSTIGLMKLGEVTYTVLDEADTLMDDSFVDRLTGIIKRISRSQLTLVSATLPKEMPDILEPYVDNFIHVTSPLLHKPLCNVTQKFVRLIRSVKPTQILQIAKNYNSPTLIFTNRNQTCYWLSQFFKDNKVNCVSIRGDMNYLSRIEQWNQFINEKTNVLVATDACSRGLDTTDIKHVVNYDFPIFAADYIHRIGRTGRLGSPASCKVTNFISGPEEIKLVQKIEMAIRTNEPISNVDGNITKLLKRKILRKMDEDEL